MGKQDIQKPDEFDRELLRLIDEIAFVENVPIDELPDGEETNRPKKLVLHMFINFTLIEI